MAADFTTSLIFNQEGNGWSETFYLSQVEDATVIQRVITDLAAARVVMLNKNCIMKGMRYSQEGLLFDGITIHNFAGQFAVPGQNTTKTRDFTNTAFLAMAHAGAAVVGPSGPIARTYRRQVWIRGLPDDYCSWDTNGKPQVDDKLLAAFNLYAAAITKTPAFCLKVWSKEPATIVAAKITNVVGDLATQRWTITAAGHGLAPGAGIRISGVEGVRPLGQRNPMKQVNGVWQVLPGTNTDTFSIPMKIPVTVLPAYLKGGEIRKRDKILVPIVSLTPVGLRERATGRAYFVRPGRRRNRALLP